MSYIHSLLFAHNFGITKIDDRLLLSVIAFKDLYKLTFLLFSIKSDSFLRIWRQFKFKNFQTFFIVNWVSNFEIFCQRHGSKISDIDFAVKPGLEQFTIVKSCAHPNDLKLFQCLDFSAQNLKSFELWNDVLNLKSSVWV